MFPLETAAQAAGHGTRPGNGSAPLRGYPVTAFHWLGNPAEVTAAAAGAYGAWMARDAEGAARASANFIAIRDEDDRGVHLFFVPRDQTRSHSADMANAIGGIEVLGELVFSDPTEKARLEGGEVDYRAVERILAAATVPWRI